MATMLVTRELWNPLDGKPWITSLRCPPRVFTQICGKLNFGAPGTFQRIFSYSRLAPRCLTLGSLLLPLSATTCVNYYYVITWQLYSRSTGAGRKTENYFVLSESSVLTALPETFTAVSDGYRANSTMPIMLRDLMTEPVMTSSLSNSLMNLGLS